MSLTLVYYTSNREDEAFEEKIRTPLRSLSIPIISVSQKPIDFGHNISVGDQGVCDLNCLRQIQIGIEAANTDFILAAEADSLYPPEYFEFLPPTKTTCFRYPEIWVLKKWKPSQWKGGFYRKPHYEGAMICGREHWLRQLEKALKGWPQWYRPEKDKSGNWHSTTENNPPHVFPEFEVQWGNPTNGTRHIPVITVKTGDGQRKYTYTDRKEPPVDELPYWGSAENLRKELFG